MTEFKLAAPTLREVTDFLDGSAPLLGVWFGDTHPDYFGAQWWRPFLKAALLQAHDGEMVAVMRETVFGDTEDACLKVLHPHGVLSAGTKLFTSPPRVLDEAMVERGLRAASAASDARLARYSVVREILKAALEQK